MSGFTIYERLGSAKAKHANAMEDRIEDGVGLCWVGGVVILVG